MGVNQSAVAHKALLLRNVLRSSGSRDRKVTTNHMVVVSLQKEARRALETAKVGPAVLGPTIILSQRVDPARIL